jgi:ribosomal 50S subunit-associated protein YjgA (DUF615 family)
LLQLLLSAPSLRTVVAVRCRRLHKAALKKVLNQLPSARREALRLLLERSWPEGESVHGVDMAWAEESSQEAV